MINDGYDDCDLLNFFEIKLSKKIVAFKPEIASKPEKQTIKEFYNQEVEIGDLVQFLQDAEWLTTFGHIRSGYYAQLGKQSIVGSFNVCAGLKTVDNLSPNYGYQWPVRACRILKKLAKQ